MLAFAFSQISRMVTLRKPCLANTSPAASTRRCRVSKVSSLAAIDVSNQELKHSFQSRHSNIHLRCQPVLFAPGVDPTLVSDCRLNSCTRRKRELGSPSVTPRRPL